MNTIRELAPKPSDAVRAMIDGLLEQSQRKDFQVDMYHYFLPMETICFGCAATCALQKLTNVNLKPDQDEFERYKAYNLNGKEVDEFEIAIDALRRGKPGSLMLFYGLTPNIDYESLPPLQNYNWRNNLPAYEKLYNQLKSVGA